MKKTHAYALLAGLACGPAAAATPTSATPNILFVIADDLGIDASPCYPIGAEKPKMPNLEALCKQGLVFDKVWAYPTCSPTRASILTGQYGTHTNVMQADEILAPTETILQQLRQAPTPYATAVIGKWHVGGRRPDPNMPNQFGADYYAGFMQGALRDYSSWDIIINGKQSHESRYATTVFSDLAINWIAQQQKPWLVWLAYNAPHTPFHVPPAGLYTQADMSSDRGKFFAAAEALDHEMGRVLDSMPATVRNNTIVFFMGDNGSPQRVIQAPFSRQHAKDSIYQGGINVPLMVAGAGVTRKNEREASLINSTDFFATFAALAQAGQKTSPDSKSFLPLLSSTSFEGRKYAFMDHRKDGQINRAVRDGRYKLLDYGSGKRELYDLQNDPFENRNLLATGDAANYASIVDTLAAQLVAYQK